MYTVDLTIDEFTLLMAILNQVVVDGKCVVDKNNKDIAERLRDSVAEKSTRL